MELTIIIPDEFAKELLDKIQISRSEPLELKRRANRRRANRRAITHYRKDWSRSPGRSGR